MLKQCAVDVVIGGVTIDEAIQEDSVEWEAPVVRRGEVVAFVVGPFSPVFGGVGSCFVFVQVVVH